MGLIKLECKGAMQRNDNCALHRLLSLLLLTSFNSEQNKVANAHYLTVSCVVGQRMMKAH